MKKFIRKTANKFGFDIVKLDNNKLKEYDEFIDIFNECKPYTMTSIERMYALYQAVEYVVKNNIPGDFYECGVWRGGSSMMVAKTLAKFKATDRNLFLFDTFEGMSAPTENDKMMDGTSAAAIMETSTLAKDHVYSIWCYADMADVQRNMGSTNYPADKIHYIQGKVEDTLPGFKPTNGMAILRLDTDWYESTKAELDHLYPHLGNGGVLIIDDYGYWEGCKKATDEYIAEHNIKMLLNRIDGAGRMGIKYTGL